MSFLNKKENVGNKKHRNLKHHYKHNYLNSFLCCINIIKYVCREKISLQENIYLDETVDLISIKLLEKS